MRRRDWGIIVFLLIMAAICIRLGIWQLDRRQERLAHNAWVESQLSKGIVPLESSSFSIEDWEFRKVELTGNYQNQYSMVLMNRSHSDQPGVHLVTPITSLNGNTGILVDRGWVSNEAYLEASIAPYEETEQITIVGIIRQSQPEPSITLFADPTNEPGAPPRTGWKILNVDSIQSQIPFELRPFYLELTNEENSTVGMPIPDPEIDLSQGPHLSYAIQWFGFAAIALVGGFAWRQRRQHRKDELNHEPANP